MKHTCFDRTAKMRKRLVLWPPYTHQNWVYSNFRKFDCDFEIVTRRLQHIRTCSSLAAVHSAASARLSCATDRDHDGTACGCRRLFMVRLWTARENVWRHAKNELHGCAGVQETDPTRACPTCAARPHGGGEPAVLNSKKNKQKKPVHVWLQCT